VKNNLFLLKIKKTKIKYTNPGDVMGVMVKSNGVFYLCVALSMFCITIDTVCQYTLHAKTKRLSRKVKNFKKHSQKIKMKKNREGGSRILVKEASWQQKKSNRLILKRASKKLERPLNLHASIKSKIPGFNRSEGKQISTTETSAYIDTLQKNLGIPHALKKNSDQGVSNNFPEMNIQLHPIGQSEQTKGNNCDEQSQQNERCQSQSNEIPLTSQNHKLIKSEKLNVKNDCQVKKLTPEQQEHMFAVQEEIWLDDFNRQISTENMNDFLELREVFKAMAAEESRHSLKNADQWSVEFLENVCKKRMDVYNAYYKKVEETMERKPHTVRDIRRHFGIVEKTVNSDEAFAILLSRVMYCQTQGGAKDITEDRKKGADFLHIPYEKNCYA